METMPYEKQIKALSKISKAITSDLYLEDILRLIVAVTAEVMRSNICSLLLIDEKKNELVIRATQSVSEEYNKKPPLKVGEGIAGKAAKENRPLSVKDVTKEKEYKYRDIARKEGLRCSPNSKGESYRSYKLLYSFLTRFHRNGGQYPELHS
jgi:signal transduction protein with GAF and PtsI domain